MSIYDFSKQRMYRSRPRYDISRAGGATSPRNDVSNSGGATSPRNGVSRTFHIFPNAILDNLELSDCTGSITGKCEDVQKVEDCVDICANSDECYAGYFIQTPDRHNLCVPLKKLRGRGDIRSNTAIGPYYRMLNKKRYPILDNMETHVFTSDVYKFPPDKPNTVFFTDNFMMKCERTGDIINPDKANLQLLPADIARGGLESYVAVVNNSAVVISVTNTTFALTGPDGSEDMSIGDSLSWKHSQHTINNIFIVTKNDNTDSLLNYQDTFHFTYNGKKLGWDEKAKKLVLTESGDTFSLVPNVQVYYCGKVSETSTAGTQLPSSNGVGFPPITSTASDRPSVSMGNLPSSNSVGLRCLPIPLNECDRSGNDASYKGSPVSRSPYCWGMCVEKKNTESTKILWITLLVLIVLSILYNLFRVRN